MTPVSCLRVAARLVGETVARAAAAAAAGVTALDHEIGDDAVEGDAVIEIFTGQENEVIYGERGVLREELQKDLPSGRMDAGEVFLFGIDGDGRRIFPLFGGHGSLLC